MIDLGIARDTVAETAAPIRRAIEAGVDILVTTGGASVGDHDRGPGRRWRAKASRSPSGRSPCGPGKPMMHGRRGPLRVLGLPGNPVSSYVCAILFLAPLIRALTGRTDIAWPLHEAVLGRDVPANDQREDYLRAALQDRPRPADVATPVSHQDSSLLRESARADALIIRAAARARGRRWRAVHSDQAACVIP